MIQQPSKSKLVRTMPIALFFWVCSVVAAPPVLACCDNFFSCAAAVVTAGATCLIDLAASALRGLIQKVEHERELKRQAFTTELIASQREAEAASEQLKQKAQQQEELLRRYAEEANRITGEDKAWISNALNGVPAAVPKNNFNAFKQLQAPGTTPSPNITAVDKAPAWNKTALQQLLGDTSLETLKRQMEVEQQRGKAARKRAEAARTIAAMEIAKSTQDTQTVFQHSFLGPVDQLLAALQSVLRNPLNAGQLINGALGILDGAFSAFDRDVVPATERDAQVKETAVANVQREADQTQRHAEKARQLLAEMHKAAQLKTVVERRALVSATSVAAPVSAANVSPIVSLQSPYRLLATSKTLRTGMMTIRPDLQRIAVQMQPPDLAPVRMKLATNFDQYFKGKQPAEAKAIRDQLILEAHRRYGADRNLLASIEKLINDEARARGVL